jgi:uncharacterized membrane protein
VALPLPADPAPAGATGAEDFFAVVCALLAISFLWQAGRWQNTVRALMEMDELAGIRVLVIGAVSALVFLATWAIGKLFRILSRKLQRIVPAQKSGQAPFKSPTGCQGPI